MPRYSVKSLLGKLKLMLPSIKRFLLIGGCSALATATLMLLTAKTPELHNSYIRQHVGEKVYMIKADLMGGGGTGFALKAPSGTSYIVTNSHVCDYIEEKDDADIKQTVLVMDDYGNYMRRRIVAISDKSDLCLIEDLPGVEGLSLGRTPDVGDSLMVVGHPHLRPITLSAGEMIGVEDVTILDYIMSVKDNPFIAMLLPVKDGKCDMPKNKIETIPIPSEVGGGEIQICLTVTKGAYDTSIVIYPGNSGSPMVDFWGRVTGVAFAGNEDDHYGVMVSLSDLKDFVARY
jgi:hypothetical protein